MADVRPSNAGGQRGGDGGTGSGQGARADHGAEGSKSGGD